MKKVVISGATKGIGKAVAFAFAAEGYSIALGARTQEDLEEVKYLLVSQFPSCEVLTHVVDFSSKQETLGFADFVKSKWDHVDILVNNVGMYALGEITQEDEGLLEKIIATNLYSAYHLTRAFVDGMKVIGNGHIFNICSILSKIPRVDAASYTISKTALLAFNNVLCKELRNFGVKVTAIIPGSTNTATWDGFNAPTDMFVQPKDVASAVVNASLMSESALVEEITINPMDNSYKLLPDY